jgi:hypothetical protein
MFAQGLSEKFLEMSWRSTEVISVSTEMTAISTAFPQACGLSSALELAFLVPAATRSQK